MFECLTVNGPFISRCFGIALPGSSLVLRGRLWLGASLLLPSLLLLVLMALAPVLATSQFAGPFIGTLLVAYLLLATIAAIVSIGLGRPAKIDEARVLVLHRQAAAAYLTGDFAAALASARGLTAEARSLPGAWRLLALVAKAAGDQALAGKAQRTLKKLEALADGAIA
jgi:hypothetical protein